MNIPTLNVRPGLYIVATPIGNLNDITLRALAILRQADLIVCEDTRVTSHLLQHYGLRKTLKPYHDHNAAQMRPKIIEHLQNEAIVAIVSDAGTPTIADPGYKLVQACIEAGIAVTPIPGASAILSALVMSGQPTDSFCFGGFLPPKSAARVKALQKFSAVPATLIFYESPRRIAEMLADAVKVLGMRPAAVCRELTKIYEEARRGTLEALADYYKNNDVKGEIVVVIGLPTKGAEDPIDMNKVMEALIVARAQGASLQQAATVVAEHFGMRKRVVYQIGLGRNNEEE